MNKSINRDRVQTAGKLAAVFSFVGLIGITSPVTSSAQCPNSQRPQPWQQPQWQQPQPVWQQPGPYPNPPQMLEPGQWNNGQTWPQGTTGGSDQITDLYPNSQKPAANASTPPRHEASKPPVAEKPASYETPVASTEPAGPWDQWSDLPPLRGDFQQMVHQVSRDLDWLIASHGHRFSPAAIDLLQEAKTNLELSCRICDEDPDLFAGSHEHDEAIRNVTGQLRQFHDLLKSTLELSEMREMLAIISPARADSRKLAAAFSLLDEESRPRMYALFAVETLQKRAAELVTFSEAVENGTFDSSKTEAPVSKLVATSAAPDFNLQSVDGDSVSLARFRGKKLVLVFSRGHFCPYCMDQVRQLVDHADELKAGNVEVVVVFRELQEGGSEAQAIEGLKRIRNQMKVPFTLATDFGSRSTSQYSPTGNFSTYVISEQGQILSVLEGVKYIRPSAAAIVNAATRAGT